MSKLALDKIRYPTKDSLIEGRFKFIADETLRHNVAIYVQYVTFLLSLGEEYDLGLITYSLYKDILIHTAHVIESLLHNKLRELISSGSVDPKKILDSNIRYSEEKVIHECGDGKFISCKVTAKGLEDDTQFVALNRAGKRSGLLTDELFKKCEEVRKTRNKIHLSGLKLTDDQYTKQDINRVFGIATEIVNRVRDY